MSITGNDREFDEQNLGFFSPRIDMAKPGAFGMHLGAIVDVRGLLTYVYTLYKLGMITILLWQILLPNQYF